LLLPPAFVLSEEPENEEIPNDSNIEELPYYYRDRINLEVGLFAFPVGTKSTRVAYQLGGLAQLWTMHFGNFTLTPIEIGGAYLVGCDGRYAYGGVHPGYLVQFGGREQYQFGFGIGIGGGIVWANSGTYSGEPMGAWGAIVSPALRFRYQSQVGWFYGGGIRWVIPLAEYDEAS